MAWGRIDDGFDDSAKVLALLEYEQGAAAIGLWTLCFSWAHRNTRKKGKTPGLIPPSLPRRFVGPVGRELAGLLVQVGLWEDRGDDGWQFHDFDQYLPTDQTRDARAEAGRRGAAARWGKRAGTDGNLLSKNDKPVANAMANDDSGIAPNASEATDRRPGRQHRIVHGNEPHSDSNLPSGLSPEHDKPMASDGSRAPARWAIPNGIAPTPAPIPVPPTAGAVEPRQPNAGDVVAAFADSATAAGLKSPPASLRARLGKQARELIAEGWPPDFLVGCAHRMGPTGFNDLAVQARKDDAAANGHNGNSTHRPQSTGAERAQAALEAGRRVQAMLDERNAS